MQADLAPDDPHRRDLEVVLRNARVLLAHVNDLLDSSKIEASKLELEYSDLDLSHLVRLVANNFETLAVDRSVQFVVVAPELVHAQVDSPRLQQVLLNLLSNAFKFTPKNGTVRLELKGRTGDGRGPHRGGRLRARHRARPARRGVRALPPARQRLHPAHRRHRPRAAHRPGTDLPARRHPRHRQRPGGWRPVRGGAAAGGAAGHRRADGRRRRRRPAPGAADRPPATSPRPTVRRRRPAPRRRSSWSSRTTRT